MSVILTGDYKDGTIHLSRRPPNLPNGPVRLLVTSSEHGRSAGRMIQFGMYPGDASTFEDFHDAQWHGEGDWSSDDVR